MAKKKETKQEVTGKIENYMKLADEAFSSDPELANKYVKLARESGMKRRIKIPRELKRKFCSKCYFYLRPSVNCTVRIGSGRVVYTCKNCKHIMRFLTN